VQSFSKEKNFIVRNVISHQAVAFVFIDDHSHGRGGCSINNVFGETDLCGCIFSKSVSIFIFVIIEGITDPKTTTAEANIGRIAIIIPPNTNKIGRVGFTSTTFHW
jgi:hypothetical protein